MTLGSEPQDLAPVSPELDTQALSDGDSMPSFPGSETPSEDNTGRVLKIFASIGGLSGVAGSLIVVTRIYNLAESESGEGVLFIARGALVGGIAGAASGLLLGAVCGVPLMVVSRSFLDAGTSSPRRALAGLLIGGFIGGLSGGAFGGLVGALAGTWVSAGVAALAMALVGAGLGAVLAVRMEYGESSDRVVAQALRLAAGGAVIGGLVGSFVGG